MTALDWLALLHPVLMILFVYPVIGATIRLGILVRERRLDINPLPPTVGTEHVDHGRWVTTGVVVLVLVAILWSFLTACADPQSAALAPAAGPLRFPLLLLVGAGALGSCLALWRVRHPALRASFALLCWAALLALGAQPEVWRLSDNPFVFDFWRSHYWSGSLLVGLLLFSMAARPEIKQRPRLRKLHVTAAFLMAVLLAVQAITGTRDLLTQGLLG
jgi:hypothetical protein